MNPNQIFDMAQKDMILILQSSTAEDIVSKKELFLSYFEFLESMKNLIDCKTKHYPNDLFINLNKEENEKKLLAEPTNSSSQEIFLATSLEQVNIDSQDINLSTELERDHQDTDHVVVEELGNLNNTLTFSLEQIDKSDAGNADRPQYLFERKLRGGFCAEINAFVPEHIVRRLGLEHGDYVYADEHGYTDGGYRKKYAYELAEKAKSPLPNDRVQLNLCPVESIGQTLVISKTLENGYPQDIRIGEIPYPITLNGDDIIEFAISEGDLIDIAFYSQKPDMAKVIYIHPTPPLESLDKTKKATTTKKKETPKQDEILDKTLDGKTILVVGNEPDKASYKKQIEDRGGIFLWADAKDHYVVFQSLVRKCDCVVFLLGVSGHTGMKQIKQLCKDYDVPFQTTFSEGISTVVRLAEEGTSLQVNG